MAKVPVLHDFHGTRPLWRKRSGIWVPLWADATDPCACCAGCDPCEGTCTTGWAAGGFTAIDCPSKIRLLDQSTPPAGYCYGSSRWKIGSLYYESNTRQYDLPWTYGDCYEVELTSIAWCCDPDHCGGCADTTTYTLSPNFCCCYGGHCVEGVPVVNWPDEVSITIDEFEAVASGAACPCDEEIEAWIATKLPGSFILPFAGEIFGEAKYELIVDEGELACCTQVIGGTTYTGRRYVKAIANIRCDGLLYAGVRCFVGPPQALDNNVVDMAWELRFPPPPAATALTTTRMPSTVGTIRTPSASASATSKESRSLGSLLRIYRRLKRHALREVRVRVAQGLSLSARAPVQRNKLLSTRRRQANRNSPRPGRLHGRPLAIHRRYQGAVPRGEGTLRLCAHVPLRGSKSMAQPSERLVEQWVAFPLRRSRSNFTSLASQGTRARSTKQLSPNKSPIVLRGNATARTSS